MSYLPLALSVICGLLWAYVGAPGMLRVLGLRLPIRWRERRDALRRLGFPQFVFSFGVMTCGMALFIFFIADAFLEWRFSEAWTIGFVPAPFNSAWRMLSIFAVWVFAGVFFGWVGWKNPSNASGSAQ